MFDGLLLHRLWTTLLTDRSDLLRPGAISWAAEHVHRGGFGSILPPVLYIIFYLYLNYSIFPTIIKTLKKYDDQIMFDRIVDEWFGIIIYNFYKLKWLLSFFIKFIYRLIIVKSYSRWFLIIMYDRYCWIALFLLIQN